MVRGRSQAVVIGALLAAMLLAVVLAGVWLVRGAGPDSRAGIASPAGTAASGPASDLAGSGTADEVDLTGQAEVSADAVSPPGKDSAGALVRYDADNLTDGSLVTAWRMDGNGGGTSILFRFPQVETVTELALTNGYTKRDAASGVDRYTEERRILHVTWSTDDGVGHEQNLRDGDRALQRLRIDPTTTSAITLTIDQTTSPGDPDRDYTAISEVRITGHEAG